MNLPVQSIFVITFCLITISNARSTSSDNNGRRFFKPITELIETSTKNALKYISTGVTDLFVKTGGAGKITRRSFNDENVFGNNAENCEDDFNANVMRNENDYVDGTMDAPCDDENQFNDGGMNMQREDNNFDDCDGENNFGREEIEDLNNCEDDFNNAGMGNPYNREENLGYGAVDTECDDGTNFNNGDMNNPYNREENLDYGAVDTECDDGNYFNNGVMNNPYNREENLGYGAEDTSCDDENNFNNFGNEGATNQFGRSGADTKLNSANMASMDMKANMEVSVDMQQDHNLNLEM